MALLRFVFIIFNLFLSKHCYSTYFSDLDRNEDFGIESFQTFADKFHIFFINNEINTSELAGAYYTASGHNNAHTSLGHQAKIRLEKMKREHFIKDENDAYHPKRLLPKIDLAYLKACLNHFNDVYFYDSELKFMLGRALLKEGGPKNNKAALKNFAEGIISQIHYENNLYIYNATEYLNLLPLVIKDIKLAKLNNILSLVHTPDEYAKKHNFKIKNNSAFRITLFNDFRTLFNILQESNIKKIYSEAAFLCLEKHLEALELTSFIPDVCHHLYDKLPGINFPSVIFGCVDYLTVQKKYKEAISIAKTAFETLEDIEDLATANHYNIFGICLLADKNYEEAYQEFSKALSLLPYYSYQIAWNKAFSEILSMNYSDESLELIKKIYKATPEQRIEWRLNMSSHSIKRSYKYLLLKMNQTDLLTELLLEKQQKAINKINARKKQRARTILLAVKKAEKNKGSQSQNVKNNAKADIKWEDFKKDNSFSQTFSSGSHSKEEDKTSIINQKKKTRGKADPQKLSSPVINEEVQTNYPELLHIEDIKTKEGYNISASSINIFYKLFTFHPKKLCFDNEIKITLHEMKTLFKSLNQKFEPAKGKGSHKKTTLNMQEFGSDFEEQMIIMTKDTTLKPYTIKQIREAFTKAHVVPKDDKIIERLKEDFPSCFQ